MGKLYDEITPKLGDWISQQKLFFVATAPSQLDGHVNCSPRGLDSFRILGPRLVGFVDLTGSGAETIAHIRENQRLTIMFCAFEGAPKILRLYGNGRVLTSKDSQWSETFSKFPSYLGTRSIILLDVARIADSCGYGVPKYDFVENRSTLEDWAVNKGEVGVIDYQRDKNAKSIDGLPALELP